MQMGQRSTVVMAVLAVVSIGVGVGLSSLLASGTRVRTAPPKTFGLQRKHGGHVERVGERFMEATIQKGGALHVSFLDNDESTLFPIQATELIAQAQSIHQDIQVSTFTLKGQPTASEAPGTASTFTGKLPDDVSDHAITLSINVPMDGKTYRLTFNQNRHADDVKKPIMAKMLPSGKIVMPEGLAPAAERRLFLTPGGPYTQKDIEQNRNLVPSVKFAGFEASHNMNPQPGDRICPITKTKINPIISWVIGGHRYGFCCPPCIGDYLAKVKKNPKELKPTGTYFKRDPQGKMGECCGDPLPAVKNAVKGSGTSMPVGGNKK